MVASASELLLADSRPLPFGIEHPCLEVCALVPLAPRCEGSGARSGVWSLREAGSTRRGSAAPLPLSRYRFAGFPVSHGTRCRLRGFAPHGDARFGLVLPAPRNVLPSSGSPPLGAVCFPVTPAYPEPSTRDVSTLAFASDDRTDRLQRVAREQIGRPSPELPPHSRFRA